MAFIVPTKKHTHTSRNTSIEHISPFETNYIYMRLMGSFGRVHIHIDTNYQSYLSVTHNARISMQRKMLGHFMVGILISIKYAQNEHRNRFRFKCKTKKKQSV